MRLIDCLNSYQALAARVAARHWGGDDAEEILLSSSCGYCAKGRTCTHHESGTVWSKHSSRPVKPLAAKRTFRAEIELARLIQLLADIDRQIDALPGIWSGIFDRMYRRDVPFAEVIAELGEDIRRNPGEFWHAHDRQLDRMESRLIDYFPAAAKARQQQEAIEQ